MESAERDEVVGWWKAGSCMDAAAVASKTTRSDTHMPQADLSEEESGRREESRKGKKGKKSNDSQKSGRARMPHENRPAGGMKRGIGGGDRIADGDGLMGWGSQMELEGGRRRLAGLFTAWPDPGAVQLQREPSRRPTRPWTGASSDPPGRRAQSIHPWIPPLSLVRPVGSIGFRLAAQLHQPLRVATRQPLDESLPQLAEVAC